MSDKKTLETYYLCQFLEKTGEIKTTLSGMGKGMLKLWALQNPKKGHETIIFCLSNGEVVFYVDKQGDIFAEGDFEEDEKNIEHYCPGLLAYFQEYDKQEQSSKKSKGVNV